jgi:hypothetical protein
LNILKRNYSIHGPEKQLAHERGLAGVEWYTTPVSRQRLKELHSRIGSDRGGRYE